MNETLSRLYRDFIETLSGHYREKNHYLTTKFAATFLMLLTLGVGQMWGASYTWSFASASGTISNRSTNFTSTSGSKTLTYVGGSSDAWDGTPKYLKMNGASQYSSNILTSTGRYFYFTAPSAAGKISISYAGTAGNARILTGTNKTILRSTITASASSTCESGNIYGLTAGTTVVYIAFEAKAYIYSITWTDVDAPTYTSSYYSEAKTSPTSGATYARSAGSEASGSGIHADFAKYTNLNNNATGTFTFATPLALNSNGSNKGCIRVYYGVKSCSLSINGGAEQALPSPVNNVVNYYEYTIPDGTSNISTLVVKNKGGANGGLFYAIEVLTYVAAAHSGYTFHYGTDGSSDWTIADFTQVGSTTEWKIEDFVIPDKTHLYVGYQGNFKGSNDLGTSGSSSSNTVRWSDVPSEVCDPGCKWQGQPFLQPISGSTLSDYPVGQATGAVGKLTIWSDSGDKNLYLSFTPNGYVFRRNSTDALMTNVSGNVYSSPAIEINPSNCRQSIGVGLVKEDGHYSGAAHSLEVQHLFLKVNSNWKQSSAKFSIYNMNESAFTSGFMTLVPGETDLYEGWVAATCTQVIFVRHNSTATYPSWDSGNKWNQTGDLTLQSEKNLFTIPDGAWDGSTTTWGNYSKKGKFYMTATDITKNFGCHFVPGYAVTYNPGSGGVTGEAVEDLKIYGETLTLRDAGLFTRSGYTQTGWSTSDGGSKTNNLGASYTANAALTLYPVWTPSNYTITLNNQSATTAGTASVAVTYDANTNIGTQITIPEKTGYIFGGYYTGTNGSGYQVISPTGWFNWNVTGYVDGSGNWVHADDVTLYAWWKTYTFHSASSGAYPWPSTNFARVGSSPVWQITNYTIPSTTKFYVGVGGEFWNSYLGEGDAHGNRSASVEKNWTDVPWHENEGDPYDGAMFLIPRNGSFSHREPSDFALGQAIGAIGTLLVTDTMSDKNLYVRFKPDGYGLTYNGKSLSFSFVGENYKYETALVSLDASDISAANFKVGLQTGTAGTYADCSSHSYSENAGTIGGRSGSTTPVAGSRGKFRIWDDSPEHNWFLMFIPVFTITYDCDGAESGCPANAVDQTNLPDPLPSAPTKSGYIFDGWYTDAGKTVAAVAGAALMENTTLYAKWTLPPSATVYNFDNGNFHDWGNCAGGDLTLVGSQSGVSYQLYKDGVASGSPVAGTGSNLIWHVNADGVYTVRSVASASYSETAMNGSADVQIQDPTLSGPSSVVVGNTITLTHPGYLIAGDNWVSSNPAVATVSSSGVVTGVSAGTATITFHGVTGCDGTMVVTVVCTDPPVSLQVDSYTHNSATFSWDPAGEGAYGYSICLTGGTGSFDWKDEASNSYEATDLAPSTTYTFKAKRKGVSPCVSEEVTVNVTTASYNPLITWQMKTTTDATWGTNSTSTTDGTNISSIGTSHDEGNNAAKNSATAKTAMASGEVTDSSEPSKSARFTFTVANTKQVVPDSLVCEVFNVGSGSRTYKAQISDAMGHVYNSTNTVAISAEAQLKPAAFTFGSNKILCGAVTVRIYAWGSGSEFRMGEYVRLYGIVDDYDCSADPSPSAPTISGTQNYSEGATITLTATCATGAHALTTYTWYKGADWATASAASPVQAAATGAAGYTFTKASCVAGDAGLYWCKASNGDGCEAHNSTGFTVIVYPTYTITYNLNSGTLDGSQKTTYTTIDDDYTLPTPTRDGYVFDGWYTNSGLTGDPVTTLESGSIGDKAYWAKWGAAVTATWSVTKVDSKLYRGGGGYSVTVYLNQADWDASGDKDNLDLTACPGVTLSNITKTINGEGKAQVTADFDITTALSADSTKIWFYLDVPSAGSYAATELKHSENLDDCSGGDPLEFFSMIPIANTCSITNTQAYTASNNYTTCECTTSATITTGGSATFGLYSSGSGTTNKFWEYNAGNGGWKHSVANTWVVLYSAEQFKAGDSIVITNGNSSSSGYYTIVAAASNNTADYHSVSQVAAPSSTNPAKNTNYYYILPGSFVSSNYLVIRSSTSSNCYVGTIKAYHVDAGGVETTIAWETDLSGGIDAETGDVDFTHTASTTSNTLGAITYSSSNTSVATVNATTGKVHIVGPGNATITATLAASGCFEGATATYAIRVEDNCTDVAGTIAATDLGCDGIQMTVSGHTATGSVSYQWYRSGSPDVAVGTNSATYTATVAGDYYVVVDNSGAGGDHCAKASTNTIQVRELGAATATKVVNSWYVKNGRRTPDVALVQTTNTVSFKVENGSSVIIWNTASGSEVTTGFGGCGFYLGDDGVIYLKGQKDNGDATSGLSAGDETLTITAYGCGNNVANSITIHKQAATTRPSVAFVVDGTGGGDWDAVTSGHASGTDLYDYLDYTRSGGTGAFDLTERNIYKTVDEQTIREHYSQFDAILITDDPNTGTKSGKKSYVDAFGTMINVRPILTMEAFVSKLANWSCVKGSPDSPKPRQYEVRLECKDHEIYTSGLPSPSAGTHVWSEIIDGDEFRHVIVVDSTLGIYNGVSAHSETEGDKKPALQGFTTEASDGLLGLGRILNGTLHAAVELQKEPAARMLVFGINAKALRPTCALTSEGKIVIRNILTYLLKTNMEEVDDCTNFFKGGDATSPRDWYTVANWSKASLPTYETRVRILAPCEISGSATPARVAQVEVVSSGTSSKIEGGTCSGSLTIKPTGSLAVTGKIRSAVAPNFGESTLKPTTPDELKIEANNTNTGALIFDNSAGTTQATVEMYSPSYWEIDGSKKKKYWSYVGVPIQNVDIPNYFYLGFTYLYEEPTGWTKRGDGTILQPFEGIGLSMQTGHMETFRGTLASTADKVITLTNSSTGENLIGNSWTAPIQIAAFTASDFGDAGAFVSVYNSGRDDVYQNPTYDTATVANDGYTTAGQWLTVPINMPSQDGYDGLKVIPAMNAFQVNTTSETTLTLDYDKLVRPATYQVNAKTRVQKRNTAAANEIEGLLRVRVTGEKTHTDVWLLKDAQFDYGFDNGWEAAYQTCDDRSAQLYAVSELGQMAFLAQPEIDGTIIGFAPSRDGDEYTFSFHYLGDEVLYLNDLKLNQSTLVSEDNTYVFTYEEGDTQRFLISATPFGSPSVTTGNEEVAHPDRVQKVVYRDHVYIIRGGKIYDVIGKIVR